MKLYKIYKIKYKEKKNMMTNAVIVKLQCSNKLPPVQQRK